MLSYINYICVISASYWPHCLFNICFDIKNLTSVNHKFVPLIFLGSTHGTQGHCRCSVVHNGLCTNVSSKNTFKTWVISFKRNRPTAIFMLIKQSSPILYVWGQVQRGATNVIRSWQTFKWGSDPIPPPISVTSHTTTKLWLIYIILLKYITK